MTGCPADWPHETVRRDPFGRPIAQVCRSSHGDRVWKCAEGWERVNGDPYCIKIQTTQAPDIYSSSVKENLVALGAQTSNLFVADTLKLVFHQLPGSAVEASPSVFRPIRGDDGIANKKILGEYHKITFIMHPCSRLIKLWEDISNAGEDISFTSFLNDRLPPWKPLLLSNETHFPTLTEMLLDFNGNFKFDQYLVFENWTVGLELMKQMEPNVDVDRIFTRKVSSNDRLCLNMYTSETWIKMTNSYAMDFCMFGYSTEIKHVRVFPERVLTVKDLLWQYKKCRKMITRKRLNKVMEFYYSSASSSGRSSSLSTSSLASPSPCTIYTYYQPAYDDPDVLRAAQNLLLEWTKAWTTAGWQPRILNETDAMRHPEYHSLKEKFESLPSLNSKRYEVSCFLRYIAMAVVGGGWMSDYDLFPLHFPPCTKTLFNGTLTVCSAFVPCLVSASAADYLRVAHLMADVGKHWELFPDITVDPTALLPQVSDMKTLLVLIETKFVRTVEFVIEASDLFYGELGCNKTGRLFTTHESDRAPPGMSSLPWAVHISHEFIYYYQDNFDTKFSELSWATSDVPDVDSFRLTFIPKVIRILRQLCQL
ncbi:hypothetical protein HOLleu_12267 [Holothuria leucospilota]|uniref:Uncharacterized protein n=1 Tax=Holothuria leucospilota TaxID=206669 RepID=A0A9Q1CAZ6_HOLLE|nr:hypothetical protein HOLleu_12267 [Holothuria leucospilota]